MEDFRKLLGRVDSESRRKGKGIPLEKIKADLVKRGRLRD
jgi:hypothetical protein